MSTLPRQFQDALDAWRARCAEAAARASLEAHIRRQIERADRLCASGQWSPAEAANHRESHARLLREVERRSSPESAG